MSFLVTKLTNQRFKLGKDGCEPSSAKSRGTNWGKKKALPSRAKGENDQNTKHTGGRKKNKVYTVRRKERPRRFTRAGGALSLEKYTPMN